MHVFVPLRVVQPAVTACVDEPRVDGKRESLCAGGRAGARSLWFSPIWVFFFACCTSSGAGCQSWRCLVCAQLQCECVTAACALQDEGGLLHGRAAGRQMGHELLKRLGSTGDVAAAARASVRAVAAPGLDGSAGAAAAPVFAVGCLAVADGGDVVGHVDDKLVARDFQGEKICDMVEVCALWWVLGRVLRQARQADVDFAGSLCLGAADLRPGFVGGMYGALWLCSRRNSAAAFGPELIVNSVQRKVWPCACLSPQLRVRANGMRGR